MTLFEITREAAREAVQMYFEPITSFFGRFNDGGREKSPMLAEHQAVATTHHEAPTYRDQPFRYGRRRALVVENDVATRHAFVEVLTSSGLEVDWADDGDVACKYLKQQSYDVLILDIVLPHVTGTAVMEFLSHTQPGMLANTIVVSGIGVSEIRRLFPDVRETFEKPVVLGRLVEAVYAAPIKKRANEQRNQQRKQTA